LSEVYLIPIRVVKCEVHVTSEVKEYVTLIIYKSKLIKLSNVSNSTFVVISCSKDILSKFKVVKFISK